MGSVSPCTTVKVAVTQHESAWLDLEAGVSKTCNLIQEAAQAGARLVAFPECWIPGYPAWIWTRGVDFDMGVKYVQNCLIVDGPEMKRIQECASENDIHVALGFSERQGESVYIAQAFISNQGKLKMTRRKMKPTHMERTVFGDASGDCLAEAVEAEGVGKVGSLSCWEHIQPLLKYYTFSQNEKIHVAAWPPVDAHVEGSPGLWSMSAEGVEGCRTNSQAYAMEAQCFVLHCGAVISEKGLEAFGTAGAPVMGSPNHGSSAVIAPDGRILVDGSKQENETLVMCDLDMSLITKNKTFADASGHYSRPDLMHLVVDKERKGVVRSQR